MTICLDGFCMKRLWIPALACAALVGTAGAEDLAGVYDKSLSTDPTMQQAEALHMASRETKTQAVLGMLPVNATANKTWSSIPSSLNVPTNPSIYNPNASYTTLTTATLALSVNLFSWNSWINLKSANASVAQAEANYLAARENLVSRVTQRYFDVLSAQDQQAALESALQSAARQLEQAERRFEVGLIAVTDVQIARAARDSSSAAVIAGRRTVAAAQNQLSAITGEKYLHLASPRPDMPLLSPDPASEDSWVSTALDQNASLIASRLAEDIAHDAYLSAIGGHLPNITLSANRNWLLTGDGKTTSTNSAGSVIGGTVNTTDIFWTAGISVPLFSGGATQSKVRAARYSWTAAKAGYETSLRQTEQQTRDAYQGVISQIAQVQALQQAVESSRISLQATEAGYEVGTKTALDVLTARQLLVQAQTSYAQAKYGYLNNIVALRLAAGNLDVETVKLINGWLAEQPAAAVTAEPGATAVPAATPATAP
jgi:outer membrane protein